MEIILDCREHDLIREFSKIPHSVKQLNVGDIHITQNGIVVAVIERKTARDLAASIKDGRAREQKARLKVMNDSDIIYLIEGFALKGHFGLPTKTLYSSMCNTMVRDRFQVYRTSGVADSAQFLQSLVASYEKYGNNSSPKFTHYTDTIRIRKRENWTPENIYIAQLMCITGVSAPISRAIAKKHTTMHKLIRRLRRDGPETLIGCEISDKRKIGKVIATRIYDMLVTKKT